jgi:hypothetical protein
MHCINTKHKDFKRLQAETGLDSLTLSAAIQIFQHGTNNDAFPTAEWVNSYMSNTPVTIAANNKVLEDARGSDIVGDYLITPTSALSASLSDDPIPTRQNMPEKIEAATRDVMPLKAHNLLRGVVHSSESSANRRVARAILDSFGDTGILDSIDVYTLDDISDLHKSSSAFYTNGVVIMGRQQLEESEDSEEDVLLHEVVHSVIVNFLNANPEARAIIKRAIPEIRRHIRHAAKSSEGKRAKELELFLEELSIAEKSGDVNEVMAWVLTSPHVRDALSTQIKENDKQPSIFRRIIDFIAHILGIKSKSLYDNLTDDLIGIIKKASKYSDLRSNTNTIYAKRVKPLNTTADELSEAIKEANVKAMKDPNNPNKYVIGDEKFIGVHDAMTEAGVSADYSLGTVDPELSAMRTDVGKTVDTLVAKYIVAKGSNRNLKDIKDSEVNEPVMPAGGLTSEAWKQISDALDKSLGKGVAIAGSEGTLITRTPRPLVGRFDLKIYDTTYPIKSYKKNEETGNNDEVTTLVPKTWTIDLKTTITKFTNKDGEVTYKTNGFNNYYSARGTGVSYAHEHAVQLHTYKALDEANNTTTDLYGTMLFEVEVQELADGKLQITSIMPPEFVSPRDEKSDKKPRYRNIVELKETVEVHDDVAKITKQSDSSVIIPMNRKIRVYDADKKTSGNSSNFETNTIKHYIKELFPDMNDDEIDGMTFDEFKTLYSDRILNNDPTTKQKNIYSRITDINDDITERKALSEVNNNIRNVVFALEKAAQMLTKLSSKSAAAKMDAEAKNLAQDQVAFDEFMDQRMFHIVSNILGNSEKHGVVKIVRNLLNPDRISGMNDADFYRTMNDALIKIQAWKEIQKLIEMLESEEIREQVIKWYMDDRGIKEKDAAIKLVNEVLNGKTRVAVDETGEVLMDENDRPVKKYTPGLKMASNTLRELEAKIKKLQRARFAMSMANQTNVYEVHRRKELSDDFTKKWAVKHDLREPGHDSKTHKMTKHQRAQELEKFKAERQKYIEEQINAEKQSGDFDANNVKYFEEMMQAIEFDQNIILAYTEALQDSRDPIVAATMMRFNRVLMDADHKQKSFIATLEMITDALYKKHGYTSTTDPYKIYSFMFLEPSDKPLDRSNKSFKRKLKDEAIKLVRTKEQVFKDRLRELKNQLYDDGLEQHMVEQMLVEFIEKYTRINEDDLKDKLLVLYDKLRSENKIDDDELATLKEYDKETWDEGKLRNPVWMFDSLYSSIKRKKRVTENMADMLNSEREKLIFESIEIDDAIYDENESERAKIEWLNEEDSNGEFVHKEERAMYDFIVDAVHKLDPVVPAENRIYNRLPGVSKSMGEAFRTGKFREGFKLLRDKLLLKSHANDTYAQEKARVRQITDLAGKEMDTIPMYYVNAVSPDVQSYDIPLIFSMWHAQVQKYIAQSSVIGMMQQAGEIIDERIVAKVDKNGQPVINRAAAKLGWRHKAAFGVRASSNTLSKQYMGYMYNYVYGHAGNTRGEKATNLMNMLRHFFTLRGLAGNFTSQILNVVQAEFQNIQKVVGKKYITKKLFHEASLEYAKNVISILADFNRPTPKNKFNVIAMHFKLFAGAPIKTSGARSRFWRISGVSDPFFYGQDIGEHQTRSRFSAAFMKGIRVFDEDGDDIGNLWEMMSSVDGVFTIDDKVKSIEMNGTKMAWDRDAENAISTKLNYLLRSMHGNYDQWTKTLIEADVFTAPLLAFRRFIQPTVSAFYEGWSTGPMYSPYSDSYRVGRFTTFKNYYLKKIALRWHEWNLAMTAITDEAKRKDLERRIKDLKLSSNRAYMLPEDEANMAELKAYTALTTSTIIISMFLASAIRDKRKKTKHHSKSVYDSGTNSIAFLYYIAYRARMEQMFYIWPGDTFKILKSPAPMMNMMDSMFDLGWALIRPWSWGDEYQGGRLHGKNKLKQKLVKNIPVLTQFNRLANMEDQLRALGIN